MSCCGRSAQITVNIFDYFCCCGVALLDCLVNPPLCFGMVLLHTFATFVHQAKLALSFGISLIGGLMVPARGLVIVLLHTLARKVHDSEVSLSFGISLISCLPVPERGL